MKRIIANAIFDRALPVVIFNNNLCATKCCL